MFHVPEKYRYKDVTNARCIGTNNGIFIVRSVRFKFPFKVIASDGDGWEHVSVSTKVRTPTWEEMCFIKDLFWDDEDWVIQFHPASDNHINLHPHCLHLWRKENTNDYTQKPPLYMV